MNTKSSEYNPQEYVDHFDPKRYLDEYYSSEEQGDSDIAISSRMSSWLKRTNRIFASSLDVGCGPVLQYPFSYSAFSERIDLADYLDNNLAEIQKWLSQASDAHDWDPLLRGVLKQQGIPLDELEECKKQFRQRVGKLRHCDLRQELPLGEAATYDLVTSFFCAECVGLTLDEWKTIKSRILGLVAPGGSVFFAAVRNCTSYQILGKWFPVVPITEDNYRDLLASHQFGEIEATSHSSPEFRESGFDEIVLVSATRL